MRILPLMAVLLLPVLFAVACAEGSSPPNLTPVPNPVLDQDGLAFKPNAVTIYAGTTVHFQNSESALHTVDVDGVDVSGDMRRGDTFDYTFDEPGTYHITCKYHPQMRATITVVAE